MKKTGYVHIVCIVSLFIFSSFAFGSYKDTPAVNFNILSLSNAKLLSSYSTPLLNSSSNRVHNIRLSAEKINGYRVKPNGIFSFNNVVGDRSKKSGFRTALILVNDKYVEGIGGGVCQLSTTLFNAADRAGLKIVERHRHIVPVNYVPRERDATVSYGTLDFKFRNTKNYPIEIRAEVKDKRLYVSIWKAL